MKNSRYGASDRVQDFVNGVMKNMRSNRNRKKKRTPWETREDPRWSGNIREEKFIRIHGIFGLHTCCLRLSEKKRYKL